MPDHDHPVISSYVHQPFVAKKARDDTDAGYSRYWLPQSGPQTWAFSCPADEVLYAGTRGGGKTDAIIGRNVWGASTHGGDWNALILRRNYADFGEMRRRWDTIIRMGLPASRIGGDIQTNYIRFENGATIRMAAVPTLDKLSGVMGHQYCEIDIDEAPEFPFLAQMIDKLKGCNRSPAGVRCQIFLTGNPGGPGASIVKHMYIPRIPDGGSNPHRENQIWTMDDGTTRVFIRSDLRDNKILMKADPSYEQKLNSIKDPNLRAAWAQGRWDVFVGQAFDFRQDHILKRGIWPIPEHVPVYMTFDWGWGAPFSIGWWWVDADDRIYRFAEWYGCDKAKPNIGIRMIDTKIAEGIIEREIAMGISGRKIIRLGDPTCQNKKPDYTGKGQGESTAEVWRKYGKLRKNDQGQLDPYNLNLLPGDPSRHIKIQQFRNRLAIPDDPTELPMLVIYPQCEHFIRTIPSLCMDDKDPEDVDTTQEDHIYDEACHICMDRPFGKTPHEIMAEKKKQSMKDNIAGMDRASKQAAMEYLEKLRDIKDHQQQEISEKAFEEEWNDPMEELIDEVYNI